MEALGLFKDLIVNDELLLMYRDCLLEEWYDEVTAVLWRGDTASEDGLRRKVMGVEDMKKRALLIKNAHSYCQTKLEHGWGTDRVTGESEDS